MIFVLQSEGKLFIMKGGVITGKRRTGMISIAIVEDEEMYAKQLQQFLHQYEEENKEMFDITVYSDGDQIVNKYNPVRYYSDGCGNEIHGRNVCS